MLKYKFRKKKDEKAKERITQRLEKLIPARLKGDENEMEQRLIRLYGKDGSSKFNVSEAVGKNARSYIASFMIAAVFFALGLCSYLIPQEQGLIEADGRLTGISRPDGNEGRGSVVLELRAENNESSFSEDVTLTVLPEGFSEEEDTAYTELLSEGEKLALNIRALLKRLAKDSEGGFLALPERLEDGTVLSWSRKRSMDFMLAPFLALLLCLISYKNRYSGIEKLEKREKAEVIRELPGFINKLCLLMDAGLVLSEAFTKITAAYEKRKEKGGEENYLYEQLLSIKKSMEETRSPMAGLLREFAVRSGVRELMRLSNILSDNIDKGTSLSDKLSLESDMLWHGRKKRAEEEGRAAETKMTLPLAMLLVSLILISAAPAFLEM